MGTLSGVRLDIHACRIKKRIYINLFFCVCFLMYRAKATHIYWVTIETDLMPQSTNLAYSDLMGPKSYNFKFTCLILCPDRRTRT